MSLSFYRVVAFLKRRSCRSSSSSGGSCSRGSCSGRGLGRRGSSGGYGNILHGNFRIRIVRGAENFRVRTDRNSSVTFYPDDIFAGFQLDDNDSLTFALRNNERRLEHLVVHHYRTQ